MKYTIDATRLNLDEPLVIETQLTRLSKRMFLHVFRGEMRQTLQTRNPLWCDHLGKTASDQSAQSIQLNPCLIWLTIIIIQSIHTDTQHSLHNGFMLSLYVNLHNNYTELYNLKKIAADWQMSGVCRCIVICSKCIDLWLKHQRKI